MHPDYQGIIKYIYMQIIINFSTFMKNDTLIFTIIESDYFYGLSQSDIFIEQDDIPNENVL
jgi:hypothetical protein